MIWIDSEVCVKDDDYAIKIYNRNWNSRFYPLPLLHILSIKIINDRCFDDYFIFILPFSRLPIFTTVRETNWLKNIVFPCFRDFQLALRSSSIRLFFTSNQSWCILFARIRRTRGNQRPMRKKCKRRKRDAASRNEGARAKETKEIDWEVVTFFLIRTVSRFFRYPVNYLEELLAACLLSIDLACMA